MRRRAQEDLFCLVDNDLSEEDPDREGVGEKGGADNYEDSSNRGLDGYFLYEHVVV